LPRKRAEVLLEKPTRTSGRSGERETALGNRKGRAERILIAILTQYMRPELSGRGGNMTALLVRTLRGGINPYRGPE